MAAVDQSVVVDAFVRYGQLNGRPKLVDIFNQAVADTIAGVQITTVSFEGGSSSGMPNEISTAKLLAIVEQALEIIDGTYTSGRATDILFGNQIMEI